MKKFFAISYLLFTVAMFAAPLAVSASGMPGLPYWADNGLVSCTGLGCTSLCDLVQTFENILSFGETIALFIAAPLLFAWGGIIIATAGANPGQIDKGKKIFTGTLIGVLITLGAYLIVAGIVNALGAKGIGGFSGAGICSL